MKKSHLISLAVVFFAATAFLGLKIAHAQHFNSSDNLVVTKETKIDGSYYGAGKTIAINGEINGDVYCVGQTATISGIVRGDVICAAQTLTISGTVEGDVRAAGQIITLDASVGKNVSVAGQTLTIGEKSTIDGDASVAGQTVTINGTIGRDLAYGAQTAIINARIGRDIKAAGEQLTLGSTAKARNVTFTSNNEARLEDGATVANYQHRNPPKQESPSNPLNMQFSVFMAVFLFVSLLFVSMILILIMPQAYETVSEVALDSPGMSLLTGFLAFIAAPILFVGLLITVIGIPLAFVAGLAWLLLLCLSGTFFAFYVGRLIASNSTNPLVVMIVGSVLVLLLYLVPFVGQLLMMIAAIMGSGMILRTLYKVLPRPHMHLEHTQKQRKN